MVLCYLGSFLWCCKASLGAATKKPRKAVPTRPRAAHVRPRKSDDEWATFPYIGPSRAAQSPPEAAPLTVGCCARAPGVLLDACGAWVLFFCSLVRASRAVLVWHLLWADPRAHPDSEPSHRRWHKKPRYIHIFQYISILSKRVFLSARVGKTVAVTSSGAAFWIGTMSIVKSRKGNNIEWKRGRRERPQRCDGVLRYRIGARTRFDARRSRAGSSSSSGAGAETT